MNNFWNGFEKRGSEDAVQELRHIKRKRHDSKMFLAGELAGGGAGLAGLGWGLHSRGHQGANDALKRFGKKGLLGGAAAVAGGALLGYHGHKDRLE